MQTAHRAAAIRAEMDQVEGRRGRGKAYPEALRRRAAAYYCARRAQGAAIRTIGIELGLPGQTLQRWAAAFGDAPLLLSATDGFERVEIVETSPPARRSSIVVRGPAGLHIEGLELDTLVELLRRLR
ncbi:hypothetical protein [Polyangium aurulentum]|uniref:hypothetical protein n=1 Tax=Polyangium aurulentum TaxID=2567896 RepID=UPI0010AE342C|nr:hypothetical protein [Polyangium aurulentum]UQA61416.1 hypothetical protein E8A73_013450 [Polyangium aurulentum]